jgi:hypothetical protein
MGVFWSSQPSFFRVVGHSWGLGISTIPHVVQSHFLLCLENLSAKEFLVDSSYLLQNIIFL